MDTGSQYIDASSYPHNVAYPTFDADSSLQENGMDALATCMENTYLTSTVDPADPWAARGSTSTALHGLGPSSDSEFDGFPPSPDSYSVAPLVDGDNRYSEQHMVSAMSLSSVMAHRRT